MAIRSRWFLYFCIWFALLGLSVAAFMDNDPVIKVLAGLFFVAFSIAFIHDTWRLIRK